MDTRHTPGEWKFGGKHSREIFATDTGIEICKIHFAEIDAMPNLNFNEQAWANAHSIAAVPKMITALKEIISAGFLICDCLEPEDNDCGLCLAIEAIAKAEGA